MELFIQTHFIFILNLFKILMIWFIFTRISNDSYFHLLKSSSTNTTKKKLMTSNLY